MKISTAKNPRIQVTTPQDKYETIRMVGNVFTPQRWIFLLISLIFFGNLNSILNQTIHFLFHYLQDQQVGCEITHVYYPI